ncbi:hypothetical protein LCGC14_1113960 [marine sediment metagenome]|uniref:Uncharacterized protein n=1 Tax=marine sediment metagenome TaxID=412755 RepID=A0A0F9PP15_9ZZZZ
MIITKSQRARMDRACPLFGLADIEFDKADEPLLLVYEVTAGATSGLEIFKANAPFKFEVLDVIIQARGTGDATGTMKLKGAGDITDTITCADTDKAINRVGTIDDAYSTIEKGGTLEVICAGGTVGNVKGLVTVVIREV